MEENPSALDDHHIYGDNSPYYLVQDKHKKEPHENWLLTRSSHVFTNPESTNLRFFFHKMLCLIF